MDSESKNKNSQTILTKRQSETESTTDADLVTASPDPVHVAKNDRASFANWYRLVDGYRVNLVLLWTARTDPILKEILLPHLSLAACRNRRSHGCRHSSRNLFPRSKKGTPEGQLDCTDFSP